MRPSNSIVAFLCVALAILVQPLPAQTFRKGESAALSQQIPKINSKTSQQNLAT